MSDQWLHLFTSNIRELYIADSVDLLGVPEGTVYQFRYQEGYVQEDARVRWHRGKGGLGGTRVLVYFSVQHAANFHPAAYVPLRYGQVVDAFVEGSTYVVKFKALGYASLRQPGEQEERYQVVQGFSDQVRTQLAPAFPDWVGVNGTGRDQRRSATLSGPPAAGFLDLEGAEGARFERVVEYVSEGLGPQFPRIFFRIASIWKGSSDTSVTVSDDGYLDLVAGNHYRIEVAHFQVESPAHAAIEVAAPPGLTLLTPDEYAIRSKYDVFPIHIFAPFRDDEIQGELAFTVKQPELGTNVRVPVRIAPSATHRVAYPALAIGGGFMALMPSILGSGTDTGCRLAIAAAGAGLVGLGVWARKSRGLPG